MMNDESKRILLKVSIDSILLFCLISCVGIFSFIDPLKRGFYCNDEALMYPYHESTVSETVLVLLFISSPALIFTVTELTRFKFNLDNDQPIFIAGYCVTGLMQRMYNYIGIFIFGAACCELLTDIAKYSAGRLRPNFISVCRPIFLDGTTCDDPENSHKYVEEFTCNNSESTPRMIKQTRLSFPSGHSSLLFYTLVFCVLYLQTRMSWKSLKLLKHVLQFLFLTMAWYTALSRISDYKHHWSDVLAGSLLGIVVAFAVVFGVSDLFKYESYEIRCRTFDREV